ncbi:MAG: hypothetical protein LUD74_06475 [Tannerellaceae bacterium]|nr:hypothetical protein [Tannerellaceae bacterium]
MKKIELSDRYLVGVVYQPDKNFLLTGEVEKYVNNRLIGKLGVEHTIGILKVRSGIWLKTFIYTLGAGVKIHRFQLDAGFSKHTDLGFRSSFSFYWYF